MEVPVQLYALLLSGAVALSLILLTGLCLSCRRHNLPTSIQQRYSEDYTQHTPGFGLAHPPYNPSAATSWGAPPSSLLSPISPQIVLRPNSITPTENESNDGYESPRDEYVNEDSYEQGSGYLMVLPSVLPETGSLRHSNQCLSSQITENSGVAGNMNVDVEKCDDSDDGSNDYVNTKEDSDAEGNMNVDVGKSDDSDDGSNDYVNTKENSGAEGNMNIDMEKSDDSDEGSNDYVNTKDM